MLIILVLFVGATFVALRSHSAAPAASSHSTTTTTSTHSAEVGATTTSTTTGPSNSTSIDSAQVPSQRPSGERHDDQWSGGHLHHEVATSRMEHLASTEWTIGDGDGYLLPPGLLMGGPSHRDGDWCARIGGAAIGHGVTGARSDWR